MKKLLDSMDNMTHDEFIEYATVFRMGHLHHNDRHKLFDKIHETANKYGYTFQYGCCGTNYLHKIDIQE